MAKAKNPRNTDVVNKQVITMPEATISPKTVRKAAPSQVSPTPIDLEAQIRQRAYELYQERGGAPGYETEDWTRAEAEIRGRLSQKHLA
jgi:hypothetical protein